MGCEAAGAQGWHEDQQINPIWESCLGWLEFVWEVLVTRCVWEQGGGAVGLQSWWQTGVGINWIRAAWTAPWVFACGSSSGNIPGFGMEALGLQGVQQCLCFSWGLTQQAEGLAWQQRCFPACFSVWVELGRQESSGGEGEGEPGAEGMC